MVSIKLKKFLSILINRILPIILILVFSTRILCYETKVKDNFGLDSSDLINSSALISLISIWLEYTAIYIVLINSFIKTKTLGNIEKLYCLPSFTLNIVFLLPVVYTLQESAEVTILFIAYLIEAILGIVIVLSRLILNIKEKMSLKDILIATLIFILLLIPSMPSYFLQYTFGLPTQDDYKNILAFSRFHRVCLYLAFILPLILYFSLRNKNEKTRRVALIYISVSTMVGFMVNYDYTTLNTPWELPLHLCNIAMFILPICYIFKTKRLFYFTYFINVFGAFLAMLMPNYVSSETVFSMRTLNYWYNHWCAFFMPLLGVALGIFEKPKIKQFYWSSFWFLIYFLVALITNAVFSAYIKANNITYSVDYFFINSDFIAKKLGSFGIQLYSYKTEFMVNGLTLVFHFPYQILFFVVYLLLGFVVWFVYNEFFRISTLHNELRIKLHEINTYKLSLKNEMTEEERENLMNENLPIKLELKNFSKKYGSSKTYAVKDANLTINGGEIFGFLGPNGAGKSTIIKSIVGILPVTEGSIEICSLNNKAFSVQAKQFLGYVPDHYALYEKLTGREYVNYFADIYKVSKEDRDERIERYIKLFELENAIDNRIRTYSHGMKQKITIMAALVHDPKIWILDEPLTGLDPNSIFQVKECMREHASRGNIVFFSSHIIDVVEKMCKRIAIIKKGNIECVKTIDEIESSGTTLEKFYMDLVGDNKNE